MGIDVAGAGEGAVGVDVERGSSGRIRSRTDRGKATVNPKSSRFGNGEGVGDGEGRLRMHLNVGGRRQRGGRRSSADAEVLRHVPACNGRAEGCGGQKAGGRADDGISGVERGAGGGCECGGTGGADGEVARVVPDSFAAAENDKGGGGVGGRIGEGCEDGILGVEFSLATNHQLAAAVAPDPERLFDTPNGAGCYAGHADRAGGNAEIGATMGSERPESKRMSTIWPVLSAKRVVATSLGSIGVPMTW